MKDILYSDIEYNGPGIYGIYDNEGKYYIGQALNVKRRLETHKNNFRRIAKNKNNISENKALKEAIFSGKKFKAILIKKLEWYEATKNLLDFWEQYYIQQYNENTYNYVVVQTINWHYVPSNTIKFKEKDNSVSLNIIADVKIILSYILDYYTENANEHILKYMEARLFSCYKRKYIDTTLNEWYYFP